MEKRILVTGASDEVICKAELSISEILNVLKKQTQKK